MVEKQKSDFDGEVTIGENLKNQERVGTIKMWKQPRKPNEHDRPALKGYIMLNHEFHRLVLWETV